MYKWERVQSRRLSNGEGHYFFGYYDVCAYGGEGNSHLAHRTSFAGRIPERTEGCEIGILDGESGAFTALAETRAWNFQQGAMLQWRPGHVDKEILFNRYDDDGALCSVIMDVTSDTVRKLPLPIACVSSDGRYALSVSFGRMFQFRPGYGYAGSEAEHDRKLAPEEDGVYLMDLDNGTSKLVLSLRQLQSFTQAYIPGDDSKLLVNHLTFNSDGSRFVMLLRNFPSGGRAWGTVVVTANRDGSGLYAKREAYSFASHYYWKNERELLIYSDGPQGNQLYEWQDCSTHIRTIDMGYFRKDGHCSYSPDRQWLLYDSYPDENRMQHLYLYHPASGRGMTLGSYSAMPSELDARCDLHPRWNHAGTHISFDSTHEGSRQIYEMDLREVMGNW